MPGRPSAITQTTPQLIASATLRLDTPGPGFPDITGQDREFHCRRSARARESLLIFLRHTSASLVIQENADPDVQTDLTSRSIG